MYRVLITPEMRKDAIKYLNELPKDAIKKSLKRMRDSLKSVNEIGNLEDYKNYLTELIKFYSWIQVMPPSLMRVFLKKHPKISKLKENDLAVKFKSKGDSEMSFADMIISRMRYDNVAKKKIAHYLESYEFKSCVYCNQAAIDYKKIYNGSGGMTEGELDHFYRKSRYPFLCTSFFNLFPCCGDCNGGDKKGELEIGFYPYREIHENKSETPFKFIFDISCYGRYCAADDVDISFTEEPNMGEIDSDGNGVNKSYEELFEIVDRYCKHKPSVAFAVRRKAFYEDCIGKMLVQASNDRLSLPSIKDYAEEILNVKFLSKTDIHKACLEKMLLDLGEKLDLI